MARSKFCAAVASGLVLSLGSMPASQAAPPEAKNAKASSAQILPRQAKHSSKFSNIWLTTQHGKRVRFYDDLVKNKVVLINLMFTTCTNICPLNIVQLSKLHELLKHRMGRDITLLSITIDPDVDSPEALNQYWQAFGAKPGWLFLTGKYAEIEKLRRELGVYDLDPIVDADKRQHSGILTIGNDRTDRWLALPIMMHLRQLGMTILRNTNNKQWHVH